jgi:hypothetical protein
VRADNDRISGLQGNQYFKKRGRGGIGYRCDGKNGAQRLSDFSYAVYLIMGYHTDRPLIFDILIDNPGGDNVLDYLIFEDTQLCFLKGHFGEVDPVVKSRLINRLNDPVCPLLIQLPESYGGQGRPGHDALDIKAVFSSIAHSSDFLPQKK